MGIAPSRRDHRGGGDLANAGIFVEALIKHLELHWYMPNLEVFYQGEAGDGSQSEPGVVVAVPQPEGWKIETKKGRRVR